MKVYLIKNKSDDSRRTVYGKGTRVYIMKHHAINASNKQTQYVAEYELVPTGETWGATK